MTKTRKYYLKNLDVLYEDNHIISVVKEEDVLSQRDKTGDFCITDIVGDYLKEKYQKPGEAYVGLVHRLDRRVGGVMVLAKTSKAASRLSEDIKDKKINKYYLVKVQGKVAGNKEWNNVTLYIAKDEEKNIAYISKKEGKESQLLYKVINYASEKGQDYTYLLVNLISGRYNQIRISFSYLGHPVVGDTKYGGIKNDTLCLWCYEMRFIHPTKKEWIEIKKLPSLKNKEWKSLDIKILE